MIWQSARDKRIASIVDVCVSSFTLSIVWSEVCTSQIQFETNWKHGTGQEW